MEKGRATGPQAKPRKQTGVVPLDEGMGDVKAAHSEQRAQMAFDRVTDRIGQIVQQMGEAVGELPPPEEIPPGIEVPIAELQDIEVAMSKALVALQQIVDRIPY